MRIQLPRNPRQLLQMVKIIQPINEREILNNPGKVSAAIAKEFAFSEFEKYRENKTLYIILILIDKYAIKTGKSKIRNKAIAEAFAQMGIMEI